MVLQQQSWIYEFQNQHHFCYFDIRNQQSLITQCVLMFLSFLICIIAFKKYCDLWKTISHRNKNANLAYLIIIIWWLSNYIIISILGYIAKNLYGIIIYIIYNNQVEVTEQLSWFSKLYFSLDWTNAFILQTLLIFVPYHWMKNISQALSAVTGGDSQSGVQIDIPQQQLSRIIIKSIPETIKISSCRQLTQYIKLQIRILAIIPIILFLSLYDFYTISTISKILLSILLFDCLVIIIILSMGIHSLRTNQLLKMQLDKEQARRLNNQYLIIILCTGFRLIYDTFVTIYGATQSLSDDDCTLIQQRTILSLIILIATCVLAHYLPVLVILRIYTVDQKPEELTKSLIVAE